MNIFCFVCVCVCVFVFSPHKKLLVRTTKIRLLERISRTKNDTRYELDIWVFQERKSGLLRIFGDKMRQNNIQHANYAPYPTDDALPLQGIIQNII